MRASVAILVGASALTLLSGVAQATVVTFAEYTEQQTGTTGNVQFSANSTAANLHSVNTGVGDPIFFSFLGLGGLPTELMGPQSALLRFNANTAASTTAGVQTTTIPGVGTFLNQPFNAPLSIQFWRASDFVYKGVDYGRNLLTIDLAAAADTPSISTQAGSHSATMNFDSVNYPSASLRASSRLSLELRWTEQFPFRRRSRP